MEAIQSYLKSMESYKSLTYSEEQRLAFEAQRGDQEAINQLVLANWAFVVEQAKMYVGHGVSLEDLVSEGNIGLISAAHDFDPTRGTRFITFAVHRIKERILNAINVYINYIRVPRGGESLAVSFLGDTYDAEGELTIGRNISDNQSTDDHLMLESDREQLDRYLSAVLSEREQKVFCHYEGYGYEASNFQQIAEEMHISAERVRQIYNNAHQKLIRHKAQFNLCA